MIYVLEPLLCFCDKALPANFFVVGELDLFLSALLAIVAIFRLVVFLCPIMIYILALIQLLI